MNINYTVLILVITVFNFLLGAFIVAKLRKQSQNQIDLKQVSQQLTDLQHAITESLLKNNNELKHALLTENNKHSENLLKNISSGQLTQKEQFSQFQHEQHKELNTLKQQLIKDMQEFRQQFDKHQLESFKSLQDSINQNITNIHQQLSNSTKDNAEIIAKQMAKLTENTSSQLKDISGVVEKRLADGFEKTTATFADVIKRLALIDEAQKKITELSTNVVSLQEVLSDKRSRGAFGEVQLESLIRNMLPTANYAFQHTLSNSKRVDCMLFLPEPTGNIAIDAKFPLESYHKLSNVDIAELERKQAEQQFRIDVRKHIQDIESKYIVANETADGAVMFIPAEAIFSEIHANFPDIIERAHKARVWIVSPTTMMAILTTAKAVLKDAATQKQVHIIQEHLGFLAKDFDRFQKRMDNLARHIDQANNDVKDVQISANKITSRFDKIEKVELSQVHAEIEAAD